VDDDALLAEIAAHPDDDTRRLVYADRLLERGDPRGEFIRLQLRAGGYHAESEARLRELRRHEFDWAKEAGFGETRTVFLRGFPAHMIGTARNIVRSRAALAKQPVTSLSILSDLSGLDELCAMPELKRLRALTVSATLGPYGRQIALEPWHVKAIVSSPHLGGLRKLEIGKRALTAETAGLLSQAPWLPALEEVSIPENPLEHGAPALLSRLRDVKWLWLAGSAVGPAGLAALIGSEARRLEVLGLPSTGLDAASVTALAKAPVLATVTRLDLERAGWLSDGAVRALASSPYVGALTKLNLKHNGLGAEAGKALGESTALRALEELDLTDNLLGREGVEALARGRGLPALKQLGLSSNGVMTGRFESFESGSEAAGDYYAGSYEVQESAAELGKRFAHRPGLIVR
jgi:uncharacterized protein (TIGR02996 family)